MAGPLYKSLHFSYSNRRTNPNPLRPAQILQRHATVCVSDSVGTEAFKKFYKEEFLMRNLKKVLSLVLCVAMMLSVMVVGAGAAFSDQSKIKNTEAVDACTALNIIGGYPDGSFKPEGNITRAEVTKMICVALNGGKEPNLATNATPTFSDVRTNANSAWAEKYIESCASQGIVSGVGGGKFAPAGNVTGTQLAKMLLVSLGYKSENEGFTGNAWATNVNTVASAKGLYAGLETIDPSAAITRDSAAQMVWNAMNAYEVEYKTDLIAGADGKLSTQITVQDKLGLDGKSKITLLEDKYDAIALTGTLTRVKQDKGKSTYSITVKDPKYNGKDYTGADSKTKEISYTDVTKDYSDLLYQNVRVLVKPDSNGKDAVVYGVYATNKNTTQTGILKNLKMDGDKAKLDGTKYDLASAADQTVYVNGKNVTADYQTKDKDTVTEGAIQGFIKNYGDNATTATKYTDAAYFQPTEVSLIAVDGTTNYSILKVKTVAVGKVTAVGSDYINVTIKKGDTSIATKTKLENDDWNWYSGVKKDDYVILTAAGNYGTNKGLVEKATVVTGKVTGTKSTDGVSVADNWYTMAGNDTAMVKRPNTGANVEMVVVNGYVYYTDTTVGSVDDMALLVEAAPSGGVNSKWEGRLIFSDGSDKVVTIEKKWDDKDDGVAIKEFHEGTGTNPNIALSDGGSTTYAAPMLVSYEVSKDVYTLTRIGYKNTDITDSKDTSIDTNGYDVYVSATQGVMTDGSIKQDDTKDAKTSDMKYYTSSTDKGTSLSKLYYESTGVVFVKYDDKGDTTKGESDASYKVVTGKAASNYDRALNAATAVANKSGNSYYAQAAFIDLGTNSTGTNSDNYAVVLDDVQKRTGTEDGTVYLITAWNGKENITVKTDDSKAADMSKGDIFSYTATGDTLADIDYSSSKQDNYYVNSFDEDSGDISLYTYDASKDNKWVATADVDAYTKVDSKDTVVLYVDSDAGKGLTGSLSDISLAYVFDSNYWPNGVLPEMSTITINEKVATGTVGRNSVTMTQDAVPNVRAYVDNASDDQITVLVVDTANNNITKW